MSTASERPDAAALRRSPWAWFTDRGVGTKILSAVLAVALVACGVGVVALLRMAALEQGTRAVAANGQSIERLARAQRAATAVRADLRDHILTHGSGVEKFAAAIKNDDAEIDAALASFGATPDATAEETAALASFKVSFARYRVLRDEQVLPASAADDKTSAYRILTNAAVPPYKQAMAALDELMKMQVEQSTQATNAAERGYRSARNSLVALIALGVLAAVVLALVVTRSLVTPLRRVQEVLVALSHGDLTQQVRVDQRDEVGQMAQALQAATNGIRVSVSAMATSADTLAAAAVDLSGVNNEIAANAEQTSVQAGALAQAADQVSRNVATVATGTEQMGASIQEITRNAVQAAKIGAQAVSQAQGANATVAELGESSAEIGQVAKLITAIAEQTNLLALNATIEAARAGVHGKGFAVVAEEVKELAKETARATEEIEAKIDAIQAGTAGAVTAINGVSTVMEQVNEYQAGIASAVEEQSATSTEINRNVSQAATSGSEIVTNINGIVAAAQTTLTSVLRNRQAADRLTTLSNELRELVAHFHY